LRQWTYFDQPVFLRFHQSNINLILVYLFNIQAIGAYSLLSITFYGRYYTFSILFCVINYFHLQFFCYLHYFFVYYSQICSYYTSWHIYSILSLQFVVYDLHLRIISMLSRYFTTVYWLQSAFAYIWSALVCFSAGILQLLYIWEQLLYNIMPLKYNKSANTYNRSSIRCIKYLFCTYAPISDKMLSAFPYNKSLLFLIVVYF